MATQPGENRTLLAPVPLTQAQVADTLAAVEQSSVTLQARKDGHPAALDARPCAR
jgi:hypothetical protein